MRGGLARPQTISSDAALPPVRSAGAAARIRVAPTSKPLRADFLVWLVAGSLLAYVWRIQDIFPIFATTKYPLLITGGILAVYFLDEDNRRKIDTIKHPITKTVGVLIILIAISIPTSLWRGFSFNSFTQDYLRNILLMAILIASVRGFRDLEKYALWFLIGGAIFNQYVQREVSVGMNGRLIGVAYYDANDLGMLIVASIPLLLYFLVRGRPWVRIFAFLSLALFVLVFLKTGSRGGFLGLVAVGAYLLFQFHAVSKAARFATVATVTLLMMSFAGEQYWGTIKTIFNPQDDYNMQEETGRMEIWKRGVGYMIQRPITGVGFQAFPVAEGTISEEAQRQAYGMGFKWSAAHNSFVQIGAELGVGGLVAFVVLLWKAFFTARRLGKRRNPDGTVPDEAVLGQALAGTIVGYAICGFFLSQAYACMALMLFAMIVALDKVCAIEDSQTVGVPEPKGIDLQTDSFRGRPRTLAAGRA